VGRRVSDLAWTRLTRRRELIAQIFENPVYLSQIAAVAGVRIRCSGSAVPVSAYYFAAWLQQCLESAGARPVVEIVSEGGEGRGELAVVEISGRNHIEVELVEGAVFEARVDALANRAALPVFSDDALLGEELGLIGPDPVYERTVGLAAKLAAGSL
jgi:glucose-6-phosphate dehydrogenase assembly protein OpcA